MTTATRLPRARVLTVESADGTRTVHVSPIGGYTVDGVEYPAPEFTIRFDPGFVPTLQLAGWARPTTIDGAAPYPTGYSAGFNYAHTMLTDRFGVEPLYLQTLQR